MLPISTPQERLVIYKMALESFKISSIGICYFLKHYCDAETPSDAALYFPEFGKYYKHMNFTKNGSSYFKYNRVYKSDYHKWRIKVLTEIIKNIENND